MTIKIYAMTKKQFLILVLISISLTMTAKTTTKTIRLKVIETSDVHGHFFPYDFMEMKTCYSLIMVTFCKDNLVSIGQTM